MAERRQSQIAAPQSKPREVVKMVRESNCRDGEPNPPSERRLLSRAERALARGGPTHLRALNARPKKLTPSEPYGGSSREPSSGEPHQGNLRAHPAPRRRKEARDCPSIGVGMWRAEPISSRLSRAIAGRSCVRTLRDRTCTRRSRPFDATGRSRWSPSCSCPTISTLSGRSRAATRATPSPGKGLRRISPGDILGPRKE